MVYTLIPTLNVDAIEIRNPSGAVVGTLRRHSPDELWGIAWVDWIVPPDVVKMVADLNDSLRETRKAEFKARHGWDMVGG